MRFLFLVPRSTFIKLFRIVINFKFTSVHLKWKCIGKWSEAPHYNNFKKCLCLIQINQDCSYLKKQRASNKTDSRCHLNDSEKSVELTILFSDQPSKVYSHCWPHPSFKDGCTVWASGENHCIFLLCIIASCFVTFEYDSKTVNTNKNFLNFSLYYSL